MRGEDMGFAKWADSLAKRLTWTGVAGVKLSVFFFALMLATIWPPLLSLGWQWYALLFLIAAIKPVHDVFLKK
jgi:hypothetical protein